MSALQEWLMREDEKAYLSQRSSWNYETEDVQDELFQLGPHALNYANELKPIFLFEVKNPHQLKLFDSVMVRDGAISLLSFFYKFPSPPKGHARLLVEESLSYLVPRTWEELVCYYSLEVDPLSQENFKGVVLTGLIHPNVISLESLENKLTSLRKSCDLNEKEVYVMTQAFCPREQDHFERTRPYYVELVGLLKSFFPKLKSISWEDLSTRDVRQLKVFDLDEKKVICSDSFVNFNLFGRGAGLLFEQESLDESFGTLELSPFHRLHLKRERSSTAIALSERLYFDLEPLKEEIDQDLETTKKLSDKSHLLLGQPREISSFLFEFLKNL